jgi:hypothetical protein
LVEQVCLDHLHAIADGTKVLVRLDRVASNDPRDLVPAFEEQLGEKRAVLASDPGDERAARQG